MWSVKKAKDSQSELSGSTNIYALKEISEAIYWLDLLFETEYLTQAQYKSIRSDAEELRRMLSSCTKTIKTNSNS